MTKIQINGEWIDFIENSLIYKISFYDAEIEFDTRILKEAGGIICGNHRDVRIFAENGIIQKFKNCSVSGRYFGGKYFGDSRDNSFDKMSISFLCSRKDYSVEALSDEAKIHLFD